MSQFRRTKVFVSYSHSDSRQAEALRHFLPQHVFDVFFDRDRLYPGWSWEPALLQTIRNTDVFVLLIGADTLDRPYVNTELDTFLSGREASDVKGLIPVLIDGCTEIPRKVAGFQALDLRGNDAQTRARSIGQAIHGAFLVPTRELSRMEPGPPAEPDVEAGGNMQRLWDSGQIGLSPRAASQMVNLGIAGSSVQCAHREMDPATMRPKQCGSAASVLCVACTTGACEESYHLYGRFCTLVPPGDMLRPGTKLFYWCGSCHGPVCVRCLQIEDDYPCAPEKVLSYRFHCPACNEQIQVRPVLNADMDGVAKECLRWTRAGGPPEIGYEQPDPRRRSD